MTGSTQEDYAKMMLAGGRSVEGNRSKCGKDKPSKEKSSGKVKPVVLPPPCTTKPSTAVIGPGDPIQLLPFSHRIDYEGELAIVIGQLTRRVDPEQAARSILGYTCANDVTARDIQGRDEQWTRAKGFDGSCPLGPWIDTDVDPSDLLLETRVNGETRQSARTSDMVFSPVTLVAYIATFMTLLPGDVVLTGTPEGVGRLEPDDRVEVEVEHLGVLSNSVAG